MNRETACESVKERRSFNPPLYIQRDEKILKILRGDKRLNRVLDLGCAECRLIKKVKEIEDIEFICGVDIEKDLLIEHAHCLQPLPWNSMFPRAKPLKIVLLSGSLFEINEMMADCDVVILSEVIEHLVSEDLSQLPEVLFSTLRPQVCIVTTPNYEYNAVFGSSTNFRHPDHKFEWTRSEFSQWCEDVTRRYTYSVEYDGVGDPPASHPGVGFCSQIAIFRLTVSPADIMAVDLEPTASHSVQREIFQKCGNVFQVAEINYPHEDPSSALRKRMTSLVYVVLEGEAANLSSMDDPPYRPCGKKSWIDRGSVYVSLDMLFENKLLKNNFQHPDDLKYFLIINGFTVHCDQFVKYDVRGNSSEEEEEEGAQEGGNNEAYV